MLGLVEDLDASRLWRRGNGLVEFVLGRWLTALEPIELAVDQEEGLRRSGVDPADLRLDDPGQLLQLTCEVRAAPQVEEEEAEQSVKMVSPRPNAPPYGCLPNGSFRLLASLVTAGSARPICTRPTPTMIFVSQADTCSRLVLVSYCESFAPAARCLLVSGIPKRKPTTPPTTAAAPAIAIAVPKTLHRFPPPTCESR
jgi:hypothetical protein